MDLVDTSKIGDSFEKLHRQALDRETKLSYPLKIPGKASEVTKIKIEP